MLDDRQLMRRYAADGSEAVFGELVARHVNLVYSAALRRTGGDAHLAQDITQLVFTDLARKARSLPENVVLAGWLHRATRYAAAQLLRAERRRAAREQEAVAMNTLASETAPDWAQIRPLLDEALDELNADDRDALILRFFEQRSLAEVGQALGANEDAARKRVTRALEKLRADLIRRGITTTAATLSAAISVNAVQSAPVGLAATLSTTAIAGTTLTATAATATKTIAMTTLQKTIIGATLAAAVGTGIYESRQASNARAETESLRQQQASLTEENLWLRRERDDAANGFALSAAENERLKNGTADLLRLRGEISRLRNASQELERMKSGISGDTMELAAKSWIGRVTRVKERLEQVPVGKIPELQFLTDQDWLTATVSNGLVSDEDYRRAFSSLRQLAKNKFAPMMLVAIKQYAQANGGQFPSAPDQLKPYFEQAVDESLIKRYEIVPLKDLPFASLRGEWAVTEKASVDGTYDKRMAVGSDGFLFTDFRFFPIDAEAWPVYQAFKEANPGLNPTNPSQILPFATTKNQKAAVQEAIDSFTTNDSYER